MNLVPALLLLAALARPTPPAAPVDYLDASLELDGRLLGAEWRDVDGDGRSELIVAVHVPATGRRELRLHHLHADGRLDPVPFRVIPVLDDVVAWGLADVRRDDPGRELVFLTRTGAWSLSPARDGLRGNIARLVEAPLVYDVADTNALPFWRYVLPAPGGDLLLLPHPSGVAVWGPPAAEDGTLTVRDDLRDATPPLQFEIEADDEVQFQGEGLRIVVDTAGEDVFLPDQTGLLPPPLLSAQHGLRAPALLDVDGDGRTDLIELHKNILEIHLATAAGLPREPTRTEKVPRGATKDARRDLLPRDIDGDGDLDLLVVIQEETGGVTDFTRDCYVHVFRNDGRRIVGDAPDQLLRFEAARIGAQLTDVDGDGRLDLVITKGEAPDLLALADPSGIEFKLTTLVYLGQKGRRPFDARPALKDEDVFDETTIGEAVVRRFLAFDCSGDGIADLVGVDLRGAITIRRVLHEDSFFGGESWELEDAPWRRFEAATATLAGLTVDDVNGDGLGDIVSARDDRLTVLLSRRTGAGR